MMRSIRLLTGVLMALAVITSQGLAQGTGTVSGTVIDQATRKPLSGAQVVVAGTSLGTITNQSGAFLMLNVPAGQRTIRVVLLGYAGDDRSVTVRAGETARVDLEMRMTAIQLDQVVVNAVTGRQERKRELGTNTVSISARDIQAKPITKMADVLVGRAAGVQMQGVAGSLGTSQRIRIRGANSISLSNEPLIFVDGVLFSNTRGGFGVGGQDYSRLNDLNPEDISGMEILKGPAASALYGTAAANGVILITTKRGQSGAARYRAYTEYGISEDKNQYPTNYLPFQVNDASKDMFTIRGNLNTAGGASAPYRFCPNYAPAAAGPSAALGTCTQQTVLALVPMETEGLNPFDTGIRRKVGMSVSGGSDIATYYVSADLDKERGVVSFNTLDRVNLRTNVGARVRDNLGVNVNAGYTRSSLWLNANDNNVFSPLINNLLATPAVPTAEQRTASPAGSRWGTGYGYYIPDIEENLSQQVVDRFIVGASTNYEPISWLTLNGNIGLDFFSREDGNTVQPNRLPISASYTSGFRGNQRNNNYIWTGNAAAVAKHQLMEELSSTTTAGGSFTREQFESTYCYGVGIVEGTSSCSATSSLFSVSEGYTEVRTIGGYIQEQLNWRDRVIVAGSIRGDDNSAFGQKFGFIYYPSVSVSWVASEEPFFPNVSFLNNLRLRGAYGMSGQRPNVRDAVTLLDPTAATISNAEISAVRLRSVGNPDLKPERVTEIEGGIDAALFDERLSLEFTYFQRRSKDALISKPLPASYGLTGDGGGGSIFDNLGSVRNRGLELALNGRVLNTQNVALNLRLSASTLNNRIEDLGEKIEPITFNRGGVQMHKAGFSAGGFFARRYEILNPDQQRLLTPADLRLIDDTVVYLGAGLPTNSQSLSGDLTLFNNLITVSALLERRAGNYTLNDTERFRCQTGYNNGVQNAARGQCEGVGDPNASMYEQARFLANRFGATNSAGNLVTSLYGYLEKADFVKLREVSFTVNTPQSIANRYSVLQGASITLSGRNLAKWTDYTGLDPEVNETGGGANFTQGEFNTQPPLRYYTVRFNFSF